MGVNADSDFPRPLDDDRRCNTQIHRQNNSPNGKIDRVLWTYPFCVDLWKSNPEVWTLDCTYKVNVFDMPLLQVRGVTSLNTTFNMAYCLVSDERKWTFAWVLECLRSIFLENPIPEPQVIVTDYSKACKNACSEVFPQVQQQLCLWHIMKIAEHNAKKKWHGSLEETVVGEKGSAGSHLPDDHSEGTFEGADDLPNNGKAATRSVAYRFLSDADKKQHFGAGVSVPHRQKDQGVCTS